MRIYVYLCMYVRVVLMQVLKVYWVCVLTPYNITNHVTRGAGGTRPPPVGLSKFKFAQIRREKLEEGLRSWVRF